MNIVAPPFSLIRTRVSESEWRFEGSDEAWTVTEEFDGILESSRATGKLGAALRAFLKGYPSQLGIDVRGAALNGLKSSRKPHTLSPFAWRMLPVFCRLNTDTTSKQ